MSNSKIKNQVIKNQRKNWIEHVLLRPAMYVGPINSYDDEIWVAEENEDGKVMIQKTTMPYNQAFHRIHIEIMSNAVDNKWRSEEAGIEMKSIKYTVNVDEGYCSIRNDGQHIPVGEEEFEYTDPTSNKIVTSKMHRAQLYFGEWLSGTNYNDEEVRKTSGLNGCGSKGTNIFSTYFKVECADPDSHKKLVISFENNRSIVNKPKVTKYTGKTGYTEVTWYSDFEKFGMDGYTDEWVGVLMKDAYDAAMVTGLNVTFNGKKINAKTLLAYSKLYTVEAGVKTATLSTDEADVVIMEQTEDVADANGFNHISFVNGIYTANGGVHVNKFKDAILDEVRNILNNQKVKKGQDKLKFTRKDLENFFMVFVRYEADKPKFESQSKHELKSPAPKILKNTKEEILNIAKKISKWSCVELIKLRMNERQKAKIQRKDGVKTRVSLGSKACDANWAGTKKSKECVLHIAEGESALSLVVVGRSAVENGHNTIGGYALRGKLLNTTGVQSTKINANKEIDSLKKILGLRYKVDYSSETERNTLRYGKVRLLCDADVDGFHITGLVFNYFFNEFRELFTCNFIEFVNTPIVRVRLSKTNILEFYTQDEYNIWREKNSSKGYAQYYKGLATHENEEKKSIFRNPKVVSICTTCDEDEERSMLLGFNKDNSDDRKEWLNDNFEIDNGPIYAFTEDGEIVEQPVNFIEGNMDLSCFINNKLRLYHLDNMHRSLPSVMDGLKQSQRKILYGSRLKKIYDHTKKVKVAQLAGFISEKTGYHHGEASLQEAITKMAQNYVGSNNINILYPSGSFGTRLGGVKEEKRGGKTHYKVTGGSDHGAPRYIYTYLEPITRKIFMDEDDTLLTQQVDDDNNPIEPVYYMPVVPMLLVNGSVGIGSGWSTNIPSYNPLDLVKWIRVWLNEDEEKEFPYLLPWWNGFKGTVEEYDDGSIYTCGILAEDKKKNTYHVTELPVGMWTNKFKLFLESLQTEGQLTFDEYNEENSVHFAIHSHKNYIPSLEGDFKCLYSKVQMGNMVALNSEGKAKRYNGPDEIMFEFCEERYTLYTARKKAELEKLKRQLIIDENKHRFIKEVVVEQSIKIVGVEKEDLFVELSKKKYSKVDGKYNYLIDMPFRSVIKKNLDKLKKSIEDLKKAIKILNSKSESDLWNEDLIEFEKEYKVFLKTKK